VVISPHNYFLFTPLLPSVSTGTLSPKSIISCERISLSRVPNSIPDPPSATRYITRHKAREVAVIEAEAQSIDVRILFHVPCHPPFLNFVQTTNKTVTFSDSSDIKGAVSTTTIPYDYLIYAVGAETQTFGIPGVRNTPAS
jgi:NADH:ubiquinone reductase (non-electrogenic)